ncbi:MAG: PRTRC system ThiF family protein [Bacteroidota bacterium]
MNTKTTVHFADNYLLQPPNPITCNIIGAGGTGSQLLTAMARMSHSLIALGHPGLWVQLFDDDIVTEANLGRQLFASSEKGLYKSVVLINRVNRFFGTNWKAITNLYDHKNHEVIAKYGAANMIISCVDTLTARFEIAKIITLLEKENRFHQNKMLYWMDFGNGKETGQVILSTIGKIKQPASKKFQTANDLPFITKQFKELLLTSEKKDTTPSCSLADALTKQDLFINSTLVNMGASLLWNLFREGMIEHRGFFINLKSFHARPLKVKG